MSEFVELGSQTELIDEIMTASVQKIPESIEPEEEEEEGEFVMMDAVTVNNLESQSQMSDHSEPHFEEPEIQEPEVQKNKLEDIEEKSEFHHTKEISELTEMNEDDLITHVNDPEQNNNSFEFDDPKDFRVEIHARDLPHMNEESMFYKFYLDYGQGWQQLSGCPDDAEHFVKCFRPVCKERFMV